MKMKKEYLIVAGLAVGAAVIYSTGVRKIAQAAVGVVKDTAVGVVYGVSDVVGLQNPDLTQCEAAKLAGNTWEASFACPANDFVKYWWEN